MRKKTIFLLAILFMIYLIPVDFTTATYLDESPDSITSFSETLPDDVLFYPDGYGGDIIELADYGEISDESYSPDYILTHVKDGSAFNETSATDIEIWFEVDTTNLEGFSYAHYLDVDSGTDCDLDAYDFNQDMFVKIDEPLPSSYAWMNGTITDPDYWNTTHIAFSLFELGGVADFYWDYGEITLHRMTLVDSDHYGESFADISDWIAYGGVDISTDGDVASWNIAGDSAYDYYYSNDISISAGTGFYVETRVKSNVSSANLVVAVYAEDGRGGASGLPISLASIPTSWTTYKYYFANPSGAESIAVGSKDADPSKFEIDYLRISPTNEMGWQHDGSTTEGVITGAGSGGTMTTDGDYISLIADGDGSSFDFFIDTTSTQSKLDPSYYQFVEMQFHVDDIGKDIRVQYYTSGYGDLQPLTIIAQTMRWNLLAVTANGVLKIRIMLSVSETIRVEFCKAYSIANYTYNQGGASILDHAYVEDGALKWSGDGGDYWASFYGLDDVFGTVDVLEYPIMNVTYSENPDTNGDYDSRIRTHGTNTWWSDTDNPVTTYGRFDISGEATGYVIYIDINFNGIDGTQTLSAIRFIDVRDWQDDQEVDLVFVLPWDPAVQFGYEAFFIFLGLIMIPVSTVYLVRGGREELSSDKVFLFLILFMMGWAFFIGGIMA